MHGKPENAANRTGVKSHSGGVVLSVSLGIFAFNLGNIVLSLGIYTLSLLGKGARYTLSYQVLIPHLLKISGVKSHFNTVRLTRKGAINKNFEG